jgi:hypothetical protein
MARPGFKRWFAEIFAEACQRSTYVLLSSLLLPRIFGRPMVDDQQPHQAEGVAR